MSAPRICLNMIVRDEAHVVGEVLDAVAPYIAHWVVVDTGSTDGTQEVIRRRMAARGIPGELHERPWRDFGHNRSEALALAQGHGDYIWVIDADDTVVGALSLSDLRADVYMLRIGDGSLTYWRRQLFRDGMPWRYLGVVHEYPECDVPYVEARIDGDYHIESRRLGARSRDPNKYARDAELLLAEVERHPDDERSVFYLAQSYADAGDAGAARAWYERRAEMPGWDEETYVAKFRAAEKMSELLEPWPLVLDAYLRAWEFRPTRAEPLHAIARAYRTAQRYPLGYLFAERAAQIPMPEDTLFVDNDVYDWRAIDEQAVCASWLGRHEEAIALCRRILARADLPDEHRRRVAVNRDVSVPAAVARAERYPDKGIRRPVAGPRDAEITVTLIAGPDRAVTEATLNSFLNCCADADRAGRVVVLAAGLSAEDRATLHERYGFLEFVTATDVDPVARLRDEVSGRYWLHLVEGWRFFAVDAYLTRLIAVLDTGVVGAVVNLDDVDGPTGVSAPEDRVLRAAGTGRYVLTDSCGNGPAMYDVDGLRARRSGAASLDEVLCVGPRWPR